MQIKRKSVSFENICVAGVVESGRIVINKGANDGIAKFMEFVVYTPGQEIKDPITGKSLGKLEHVKGEFKVFHIQDNMTTLLAKKNLNKGFFSVMNPDDAEMTLLKSVKEGDSVRITNVNHALLDD